MRAIQKKRIACMALATPRFQSESATHMFELRGLRVKNFCLLLVGKALFIQGFWGPFEEVPVTRDMTVYKRCNC
jgi:hypothetical protein